MAEGTNAGSAPEPEAATADSGSLALLAALPADVRAALALRLAPRDFAALSCTGHAWADTARGEASLWREMAQQLFGREAADTAWAQERAVGGAAWAGLRAFRRAREAFGRVCIAAAAAPCGAPPVLPAHVPPGSLPSSFDITWGNDRRYWRIVGEEPRGPVMDIDRLNQMAAQHMGPWPGLFCPPGATFGAVAHCSMVCWFDVRGVTQRPLPPGRYAVTWRVRLEPHAGRAPDGVFTTSASVRGADADDAASAGARAERHITPADWPPLGQWGKLRVGELTIPAGSSGIVELALWRHSGDWVMGLSLDYVQLERLD